MHTSTAPFSSASHGSVDRRTSIASTWFRWCRWTSRINGCLGGAFTVHGHRPDGIGVRFRLNEISACKDLDGRLVARFEKDGRNCYRIAENYVDEISVWELRPTRLGIPDFPGFKGLHVTKHELDCVVRENHGGWRAALSSVAGVYLITDSKSGRFYVGSATGKGGIWQRWCQYSKSGHGGNRDLNALLGAKSLRRAASLQFSVLGSRDR